MLIQVCITASLVLADGLGGVAAMSLTYWLRFQSGLFESTLPVEFTWMTAGIAALFWVAVFAGRSGYKTPIALSRFDELYSTFNTILIGILIIFIVTFDSTRPMEVTRLFLLNYGVIAFILIGTGRVIIRTFQRRLRIKGIGLRRAVIVGFNEVGKRLHTQLHNEPVWGFNVAGFIDQNRTNGEHLRKRVLGGTESLARTLEEHKARWVLIAPESDAPSAMLEVFDRCGNGGLRFMMVADYYQMVIGLVRTVQIHGLPLVEIAQRLVPIPTRVMKRLMDVTCGFLFSLFVLLITPIVGLIIKLDSAGPIFYLQKRIGRRGRQFTVIKYRSMVQDAEKNLGAVWAQKNDPRTTRFGGFLRKSYIDELPQFFNVLVGSMSLVGPRPERKPFVDEFKHKIPLYDRRLRIKPGITGWAQVRHKYDESFEDVVDKTRYDIFYIDHISIALDVKILLATLYKVIKFEGH